MTISVAVSSPVHLIMFAGYSVTKIAIIFLRVIFWFSFKQREYEFERLFSFFILFVMKMD